MRAMHSFLSRPRGLTYEGPLSLVSALTLGLGHVRFRGRQMHLASSAAL